MIFRFGRFELDESTREFRLGTRPLPLQPRVFDLLAYLLRHRDRVVTKNELLAALWPDVVVTDSSIMRAVSLIRSVLRKGGQPDAIQTFSRQGYRFTGTLDDTASAPAAAPQVARARAAASQGDWAAALEAYQELRSTEALGAGDFEQWAHAALFVGQPDDAVPALEQAIGRHLKTPDKLAAARVALILVKVQMENGAVAVAKGCHRRAGTFLGREHKNTREYGLYLWLASRLAMFESDFALSLKYSRAAEAVGRRLQDPDVEALGLTYRGHVELATGEIRAGLLHMDEGGAAALAGTVSTWVASLIFCSIIWAYLDRGDLVRAGQWTDQFVRWARRNTGFGVSGYCRLHQGEVLCSQGDLVAAESEIRQARELLGKSARSFEGDTCRVLGEIRLLRGDHVGAEESFRQAHELGWSPIPGWAILQAETGQVDAAIKALQRGLRLPNWADGQRRGVLLAHLTIIAARAGRRALAREQLALLRKATNLRSAIACEALYQRARGEVALGEGKTEEAVESLREAIAIWLKADSRINVAHTRLRLAEILLAAGEADAAELERAIAEKAFVKMGAQPMVDRCRRLAGSS